MPAPIRMVGGAAASESFRLELDPKGVARAHKLLDHYEGANLRVRMEKATLAAAKMIEPSMKQATPVGPADDPNRGLLRRRTRARTIRQRTGFTTYANSVNASVGPTSPHRHLVIRGHRIVTRGGRDTGRMSRHNPYVDAVAHRLYPAAIREMRRIIYDTEYGRASYL